MKTKIPHGNFLSHGLPPVGRVAAAGPVGYRPWVARRQPDPRAAVSSVSFRGRTRAGGGPCVITRGGCQRAGPRAGLRAATDISRRGARTIKNRIIFSSQKFFYIFLPNFGVFFLWLIFSQFLLYLTRYTQFG